MRMVLLGESNTRRTEYFLKAAEELNVCVDFYDIHFFEEAGLFSSVVKIDPFHYESGSINKIGEFINHYENILKSLDKTGNSFLNEPQAILKVLDKKAAKEALEALHIPVTRLLPDGIAGMEELKELIADKRLPGVFVKPRYGSGAAGILAYRFQPSTGRQVLYTSARIEHGELINTKRLQRLENEEEIVQLLPKVLGMDIVVEQWEPKAKIKGKSYDLRVVVQFGEVDYIIGRQSAGPITNLQLNNGAVPVEQLGLSEETIGEVKEICLRAVKAFPGLSYAGIDVLLSEQNKKPYIIEVNGQGDLIYQDIFHENKIYKKQILHCMKGG